jgi:hypothetical protein
MPQFWEYRVHTARWPHHTRDEERGRGLTNITQPSADEEGANGWEIFAVQSTDDGTRLFMKRPKPVSA